MSREKGNYAVSGRLQADEFVDPDAIDGDAHILEIAMDTECNAACVICGPGWSSLWRKQNNWKKIHVESYSIADQIPTLIDLSKITRLGILGGEPFINDFHVKILKMIPTPENVTLSYPTNGSIWPDDSVFELWSRFKKVIINFSIDDMYERFTYIRWPLKWSRVEENFRRFVGLVPNSNLQARIQCTINPFNIWYIDELSSWCKQVGNEAGVLIEFSVQAAVADWGLDCAPESLRQAICDKYPAGHKLVNMLDYHVENKEKGQRLIKLANSLDSVRNNSWQQTFPEVAHHFYHTPIV
jgi:MoaA/NifB/PqqE/SkfB family radical SAM enzyme